MDVGRSHLVPSAPARRPAVGRIDQTEVAFKVFSRLLEEEGVRAALYSVLRKSDYRFIGIFRFRDGKATSSVHVDREDLSQTQAPEVPDTATYCSFVRATSQPFVDAGVDSGTVNHPARNAVRSYCVLPLFEADGAFIGTLCHYDVVPRDPEQLDVQLLTQVGVALARSGLIPPYPAAGAPAPAHTPFSLD